MWSLTRCITISSAVALILTTGLCLQVSRHFLPIQGDFSIKNVMNYAEFEALYHSLTSHPLEWESFGFFCQSNAPYLSMSLKEGSLNGIVGWLVFCFPVKGFAFCSGFGYYKDPTGSDDWPLSDFTVVCSPYIAVIFLASKAFMRKESGGLRSLYKPDENYGNLLKSMVDLVPIIIF